MNSNVFEVLSFDFMEFATSLEGILMIIGCVFLLIGIVMLLLGKGKKEEKGEEINNPEPAALHPDAITPTPVAPINPEPEKAPEVVNNGLTESNNNVLENSVITPASEPINFTSEAVAPVENVPVVPLTPEPTPAVTPIEPAPVVPEIVPAATTPVEPTPVVSTPTENVAPAPEPTPVTVYGGVDPNASVKTVLEEKPREIYGGANPLENTAPIPTETVKEVYQGNAQVAPAPVEQAAKVPVAPVAQEAPTPQVAPEPVPTPAPAPAPETPQPAPVAGEEIETLEF